MAEPVEGTWLAEAAQEAQDRLREEREHEETVARWEQHGDPITVELVAIKRVQAHVRGSQTRKAIEDGWTPAAAPAAPAPSLLATVGSWVSGTFEMMALDGLCTTRPKGGRPPEMERSPIALPE